MLHNWRRSTVWLTVWRWTEWRTKWLPQKYGLTHTQTFREERISSNLVRKRIIRITFYTDRWNLSSKWRLQLKKRITFGTNRFGEHSYTETFFDSDINGYTTHCACVFRMAQTTEWTESLSLIHQNIKLMKSADIHSGYMLYGTFGKYFTMNSEHYTKYSPNSKANT